MHLGENHVSCTVTVGYNCKDNFCKTTAVDLKKIEGMRMVRNDPALYLSKYARHLGCLVCHCSNWSPWQTP